MSGTLITVDFTGVLWDGDEEPLQVDVYTPAGNPPRRFVVARNTYMIVSRPEDAAALAQAFTRAATELRELAGCEAGEGGPASGAVSSPREGVNGEGGVRTPEGPPLLDSADGNAVGTWEARS